MKYSKVLVSGAVIYKEYRGKRSWLVIKKAEEDDWEIPKTIVRKGESSVRAAIRMMGEQAGMSTKVLEEAGRAHGSATVNGRVVPQRFIYYLMLLKSSGEILGFERFGWFQYAKAARNLTTKREKVILKQAREELKKWKKDYAKEKI